MRLIEIDYVCVYQKPVMKMIGHNGRRFVAAEWRMLMATDNENRAELVDPGSHLIVATLMHGASGAG